MRVQLAGMLAMLLIVIAAAIFLRAVAPSP